jgi:hypothetical protein
MTIPRRIILRIRNVSKKVEKIKEHILRSILYLSENCVIYETMWDNMVQPGRPQMTIWRTRIACWIPKATDTHSEYVILTAFPLQQWLHERVSMLCYTCIVLFDLCAMTV